MAEWLYEDGIGEARAALVERGRILELAIERDDGGPRAGAVLDARLTRKADRSGRGLVILPDGAGAQLTPVPPELTEGAALRVEIAREALLEAGGTKPIRVRPAPDQPLGDGPLLRDRLKASRIAVKQTSPDKDQLGEMGWHEALEEAASGIIARPEAMLRISLTPAMTLIDIDGAGPPAALAVAGARLAGETIRRFAIAGSIGIDLPTLAAKADRLAAAQALDQMLPPPFERTAVNGFGFLQMVRRRVRPSLIELLVADPVRASAMALLRQAERAAGHGGVTLVAAPPVIALLRRRPEWCDTLAARHGVPVALREDAALAISATHAARDHPK